MGGTQCAQHCASLSARGNHFHTILANLLHSADGPDRRIRSVGGQELTRTRDGPTALAVVTDPPSPGLEKCILHGRCILHRNHDDPLVERLRRLGFDRAQHGQAQSLRQRVGHSGVGRVRIGVRREQCASRLDELVNQRTFGV